MLREKIYPKTFLTEDTCVLADGLPDIFKICCSLFFLFFFFSCPPDALCLHPAHLTSSRTGWAEEVTTGTQSVYYESLTCSHI